ncbi:MAG: hypothetical protein PHY16_19015 [Methylobacter sp.]|nr:hypothetical protein [Methylobacter sp.]
MLALYLRQKIISLTEALMADREFTLLSTAVMSLVDSSSCSAYDCEFMALARQLAVNVVTQDKKLLREFPETAISIDDFLFGTKP